MFGASWCDGCKTIKPIFTKYDKNYGSKITLAYVDVDVVKGSATNIPTFRPYVNGKALPKHIGDDVDDLKQSMKLVINYKK